MQPYHLPIPSRVWESQLPRLLVLLNQAEAHPAVVIDIAAVKFLAPAAIVAILARWHRWKREGKGVSLVGMESCENLSYLQRIDFLTHLGVEIPENFTRLNPAGRFVPVQTLNFASGDVDKIASEISRCTLPGVDFEDDVFRLIQYAAGELLSNAKYHSGGRAFVCAQFEGTRERARQLADVHRTPPFALPCSHRFPAPCFARIPIPMPDRTTVALGFQSPGFLPKNHVGNSPLHPKTAGSMSFTERNKPARHSLFSSPER
jgi:hypothetical protein